MRTLRTEIESMRRILDDNERPWAKLDRGTRALLCAMLDIALQSPDTTDGPQPVYEARPAYPLQGE